MKVETVKYMLMVQDMDRALSFYTGVIGLKVGYQSSPSSGANSASVTPSSPCTAEGPEKQKRPA